MGGRKHDLMDASREHSDESTDSQLVTRLESARLPTIYGLFDAIVYCDNQGIEHVALQMGDIGPDDEPLVRIHSECLTGDSLGSVRCDCRDQLSTAMTRIAEQKQGVVIYLRQEGRGIGLANKIHAYSLQDRGLDTVDANLHLGLPVDSRSFSIAAQILCDLGIRRVRLLTNNPRKIEDLRLGSIEVVERVVQAIEPRPENRRYLQTKAERLGHMFDGLLHDRSTSGPTKGEINPTDTVTE